MIPEFFTARPRKYLAGKKYQALTALSLYGDGELPAGTIFEATGHLGSSSRAIYKGRRHPKDLYVEVLKTLETKEKGVVVTNSYWIPADQMNNPLLVKRLIKKDLRRSRQERVQERLSEIRKFAAPLHCPRKR